MKTMAAGQFKAHCLRILDEVRARREPVVITTRLRTTGAPATVLGCTPRATRSCSQSGSTISA